LGLLVERLYSEVRGT